MLGGVVAQQTEPSGSAPVPVPALVVTTEPVEDVGSLVGLLPAGVDPVSWVRRGDGLVGWGTAARMATSGLDRFGAVQRWLTRITGSARIRDDVGLPGSGLLAFCALAFGGDSEAASVAVVPEVVVGRRAGRCWVTRVRVRGAAHPAGSTVPLPAAVGAPGQQPAPDPTGAPTWSDASSTGPVWRDAVARAVTRIRAGEAEKVVLARATVGRSAGPVDVRRPLRRLAADYRPCWTFAVDGLFGATPELLLRSERGLVTSRVLAGTIGRTGDAGTDAAALARTLSSSSKDLSEHRLAVESAAAVLRRYCSSINVPDEPFVLDLPNVLHLATDVTGVLASRTGLLDLVAQLHPTAAVGGTPQAAALAMIAELEGLDRGRYAGPVGWVDARGDGEFGIALRCAQLDPADARVVRAYAGCGIVGDSDPDAELAESTAKLVPIRDALAG